MATADRAAVVSSIEELSDDSTLQEARSCEDEEFLLFLLIRERQSHVRIEHYFKRIKPLFNFVFTAEFVERWPTIFPVNI